MTKLITDAYAEASRYWHLACSYDRLNPEDASVTLSEGNPHTGNYRKALAKLEESMVNANS